MNGRSASAPPLPRRPRRGNWPLLACALPLALLFGCTTQQRTRAQGTLETLRGSARFAVGSVGADLTVVGDSRHILEEALADALSEDGIGCAVAGSASCYTLDATASLREPAAAFRAGAGSALRVAELSASLRAPGSRTAAAPITVQHTVAATGNLSTATWMRVSDGLAAELASALAARGRSDAVSILLPAWATHNEALSRVSNVQAFHVAVVGDSRADREAIGAVADDRGGSRPVRLARAATDYLTEAITDELRAAGHTIVPAPDGRFVGSELSEFWIEATPSAAGGGWTIEARVALQLEVAPPVGLKRRKAEAHSCRRTDRVSFAPGDTTLARVLESCIGDLMRSIRADAGWSQ
ncbi:MAG: hypothetical protein HY899_04990 [Deltaproteobacteria bacterium]|nr:hypothetical protein [Deltaproteobacteria bacterium]